MAPMTPFTYAELYDQFTSGLTAAEILDMDPDYLAEHCENALRPDAAPDCYPQLHNGLIDFDSIADIVRSQAEAVFAAEQKRAYRRQPGVSYNQRYNTVLVYAGQAGQAGSDNERMAAWRKTAQDSGLTLGKWLARLADTAAGLKDGD